MRRAVTAVALAILIAPAAVVAARAPSVAERTAITRALPAFLRAIPAECVWFDIRVSKRAEFASVQPRFLVTRAANDRCVKFASDGSFVLRRRGTRWRVVYNGSELPPCSRGFPKDLGPCSAG